MAKKYETTTSITTTNQALIEREIESEFSSSNDLAVALIEQDIDSIKPHDSSRSNLCDTF